VDEFSVPDQDQLDLFGDPGDSLYDPGGSLYDPGGSPCAPGRFLVELIDAGWDPSDHGDPATDPDDDDAWLASLPSDIRADLESRPPLPPVLRSADGDWLPGAARAGFAARGFADAALPGPGLADLLTAATADGLGELSDDELAGVLRGWQRLISHGQARLAHAVTELAGRRAAGSSRAAEHLTDELAIELTLTRRSAGRLLELCDGLDRLADVYEALVSGTIDWSRACVFADELAQVDDATAAVIAARLADQAAGWTTGQLRAALARAVLAADPAAAQRRRTEARKDTRIEVWHEPSGNAALAGRELHPADAVAADAQLTADADWLRDNGAAGTLAELRAAAYLCRLSGRDLAELLPSDDTADDGVSDSSVGGCGSDDRGGGDSGSGDRNSGDTGSGDRSGGDTGSGKRSGGDTGPDIRPGSVGLGDIAADSARGSAGTGPGRTRPRGSIHLTMPLAALAGLTDAPGEIAGFGPADAPSCRDLTARLRADSGTRWCLTLTGADGRAAAHACAGRHGPDSAQPLITWAAGLRAKLQFLETGSCSHARQSRSYVWPTALRHLIEVRQRTCTAPGCRRPAIACDIDHTVPFEAGGATCECNGGPLCRRHHRAKQAPGWHLTQDQPGIMTWQLPSGRSYATVGDTY
jgi:hypothetical protein